MQTQLCQSREHLCVSQSKWMVQIWNQNFADTVRPWAWSSVTLAFWEAFSGILVLEGAMRMAGRTILCQPLEEKGKMWRREEEEGKRNGEGRGPEEEVEGKRRKSTRSCCTLCSSQCVPAWKEGKRRKRFIVSLIWKASSKTCGPISSNYLNPICSLPGRFSTWMPSLKGNCLPHISDRPFELPSSASIVVNWHLFLETTSTVWF